MTSPAPTKAPSKVLLVSEFGFRTEVTEWFCEAFSRIHQEYDLTIYGCVGRFYCPFTYVPLPEPYRRVDRLGIAYSYAYAFAQNRQYDKIIHIDNDCWFKDMSLIRKMAQMLDENFLVGIREQPIHTCFFGVRTELFQELDFAQMVKLFFTPGQDFFRTFAGDVFARRPCAYIHCPEDAFIHYGGLQRAIEYVQFYLEDDWGKLPTASFYFVQVVKSLYDWSTQHDIVLTLKGQRIDAVLVDEILKKIRETDFNWKGKLTEMQQELVKTTRNGPGQRPLR